MTLQEYAKSNYRFLNLYQTMLFISNGANLVGCYVSVDSDGKHNLIYVFEKNKYNEELLTKFRNRELDYGSEVISFEK